MASTERRSFLAILGAGTVAAADFLYPGVAQAKVDKAVTRNRRSASEPINSSPRVVKRMVGADPGFASGVVVAASQNGVILRSDAGVRTVLIPPGTAVWKEYDVTGQAIELGDWVDVRGAPQQDGSLQARSGWIWVNIGRVDGTIRTVRPREVVVTTHSGHQRSLELSPRLEVIYVKSGASVASGAGALRPGMFVGAVGLRLPDNGFRATRIWIEA